MTQLSVFEESRSHNGSSVNREAEALTAYVKAMEFDPYTFVILVCRHGTIEVLANKLNQEKHESAFKRFRNITIKAVDCLGLSAAITKANDSLIYDNLVIIASGFIRHLQFNVGSEIVDLKIYRCDIDHNSEETLLLDGLSTFRRHVIQHWGNRPRASKFWLGPRVAIRLDLSRVLWKRLCEESRTESEFDRDRVPSYVDETHNTESEDSWWSKFKRLIVGILNALTSAIKSAPSTQIKMSPGGIFVSYCFFGDALNIAARVAGAAIGVTTMGSAMLVAAGVATAFYFIPWESVFDCMRTIISWLQEGGIKTIWEKIKDWLANLASTIRNSLMPEGKSHHPFAFPA